MDADLTFVVGARDAAGSVFTDVKDRFLDLRDSGELAFDDIKDKAGNAGDEIREKTGVAVEEVKSKFADLRTHAKEQWVGVRDAAVGSLKDAASGAKDLFVESFGELRDVAQDQLKFGVASALEGIGLDPQLAHSIGRNMAQLAGTMGDQLTGALGNSLTQTLAPKVVEQLVAMNVVTVPAATAEGTTIGTFLASGTIFGVAALPALLVAALVAAVAFLILNPDIAKKALDVGVGIVRGILDGLAGLVSGLVTTIVDVFGKIWVAGEGIAGSVVDFAKKIPGAVVDGIASLAGDLIKAISTVWDGLWHAGEGIAASVVGFAGKIPGAIAEGIIGIGAGAVDLAVQLIRTIGHVWDTLWRAGEGIAASVVSFGGKVVGGIIDGLVSLPGQLFNKIREAFEAIDFKAGPFHVSGKNGITVDPITIDVGDFHSGAGDNANAGPGHGSRVSGTGVTGHAAGGTVWPGGVYLVGEEGPELFRPASAGSIVSNRDMGGYGGGDTHLHVHGDVNLPGVQNAREFWRELDRFASRNGVSIANARH